LVNPKKLLRFLKKLKGWQTVKISKIDQPPPSFCAIDASTNSLAFAIFKDGTLESIGKINFQGNSTYEKINDAARKTQAFFAASMETCLWLLLSTQYLLTAPRQLLI
jgi:hypothetical protein